MKRSANFLTVLMLSAVVILLANLSSAEAGGNCQAKLVGKSYDCNFTDNDFPPYSFCLEFGTGGVSQYFDVLLGSADYGCACDPTGSSFDKSSSTFECSDNVDPFSLNGKIKGKKLSVQGVGSDGEQYIGACTLRSSPCL
jgi:hypothetical protein